MQKDPMKRRIQGNDIYTLVKMDDIVIVNISFIICSSFKNGQVWLTTFGNSQES